MAPRVPGSTEWERVGTALMFKNSRHLFKRQYVRLKGWLTLGSIGIMPRLIIAFASVGALAATANLIVENGVAILEQQRNVAMERSALDAQQIIELRESMGRARHAAMSAEVLGAWGEFDRATQEHADADSRASATQYAHARAALDRALGKYLDETGPPESQLPRLIAEHKKSADKLVQVPPRSPRAAHEILGSADGHGHARQDFDRAGLENHEPRRSRVNLCSRFARSSTRCARRSRLVVHSTAGSWTPVRSAGAERTFAATLRDRETALRTVTGSGLVPRDDRRRAGADDHTCCPVQE